MSICKSSSQVPHQSFRAQTAALLTPAFGPPAYMLRLPETHFSLRGAIVLITQILTPNKIKWIKCSFLKFSQVKDMAYTIRVP